MENMPGSNLKYFWFDFPLDQAEEKKKRIDAFLSLEGLCPTHRKKPEQQTEGLFSNTPEEGKRRITYKCCCEPHRVHMKNFFTGLFTDHQL